MHWLTVLLSALALPVWAQSPRAAIVPPDGGDSVYIGRGKQPTRIKVDPVTAGSPTLFVFEIT